MPSGFGGGSSGGSHGGGHFGGSHNRGRSSWGSNQPHRNGSRVNVTPIFFWGGLNRRVNNPDSSDSYTQPTSFGYKLLSLLSVILGLALFACIVVGMISIINISTCKQDYSMYQNMCKHAMDDERFCIQAEVVSHNYNPKYKKWYFNYQMTDGTESYMGYTFCVYTEPEIKEFEIGSTIDVAMDTLFLNATTDSVPLDYYQMDINRDGQYVYYKQLLTIFGILVVVDIAALITVNVFASKMVKKYNENKFNTDLDTNKSSGQASDSAVYCNYCNSKLSPNATTCPHCGASATKK